MTSERKGKYVLTQLPDGWQITNTETGLIEAAVKNTYPGAEAVIRFAWQILP